MALPLPSNKPRPRSTSQNVPSQRRRIDAQRASSPRTYTNYRAEPTSESTGAIDGIKEASEDASRKMRALRAGQIILWTTMPLYIFQVTFWLVGLVGIGLETVPIVDFFAPGTEIYMAGYIIVVLIGIASMTYAAFVYTVYRVGAFEGVRGFVFICCMAGYFTMFLNLFPWIIGWVAAVALAKGNEEHGDS